MGDLPMLAGKRILLIIGGGIAAYKALELIRLIQKAGGSVTPVLTRAGSEFVTPLSVGALAKAKVHEALFDLTSEAEMGHIELSRSADLLVVAPATADLLAKMATGRADDLASTLLLATDKRVLVVPAMNVRMWEHPATQRNLAVLRGDHRQRQHGDRQHQHEVQAGHGQCSRSSTRSVALRARGLAAGFPWNCRFSGRKDGARVASSRPASCRISRARLKSFF